MDAETLAKRRIYNAAYRAANPEKVKVYARKYANSPKGRAKKISFVNANRAKVNQQNYEGKWRLRGIIITRPKPDNCECCGRPFARTLRGKGTQKDWPVLDHCHDKNVFRGWLCSNCNTALGMLGDSLDNAEKLVAYLRFRADI